MKKRRHTSQACPCGSGLSLEQCCVPFILGYQAAPSAEALMRSRYTAYVLHNEAYLLSTWHPSTRPQSIRQDNEVASKWTGLEIISCEYDSVEFIARYKIQGKAYKLQEKSRFVCENSQWYYVDGDIK